MVEVRSALKTLKVRNPVKKFSIWRGTAVNEVDDDHTPSFR